MSNEPIFKIWASVYRERGLWPRPIRPGGKACFEKEWQTPDNEQPLERLDEWAEKKAHYGIGLLMGTPLNDGTFLGALDIDHDRYFSLGKALLKNPPCGRIGKKGAVFFVRVVGDFGNPKFSVKDNKELGQVAECLFRKALCVIPPTIHPDINQAYHGWHRR